jgi:hypothetical protein
MSTAQALLALFRPRISMAVVLLLITCRLRSVAVLIHMVVAPCSERPPATWTVPALFDAAVLAVLIRADTVELFDVDRSGPRWRSKSPLRRRPN